MATVLHLRKELVASPVALDVPSVVVRSFRYPDDVSQWLALRERAMASEVPRARAWSVADFQAEMVHKPWWRAELTWLVVAGELRLAGELLQKRQLRAKLDGDSPAT